MKSPDNMAVFACSDCHDVIDGRRKGEFEQKDLLRALAETQIYWIENGFIIIK